MAARSIRTFAASPPVGALTAVLFVLSSAIVLATFRLNRAAGGGVNMAAGQHGGALDFAITALAGSGAAIALGVLFARVELLHSLGRNTLPLLGLNGLFFGYVDPKLAHVWHIADSPAHVLLASTFVTALSLLACAPVVWLMNRFVPQLIGKGDPRGRLSPAPGGAAV